MNITDFQTRQMFLEAPELNKLSFTMLVNRLRRRYIAEGESAQSLSRCTEEINYFLNKYKHAMAADYEYVRKNYADIPMLMAA